MENEAVTAEEILNRLYLEIGSDYSVDIDDLASAKWEKSGAGGEVSVSVDEKLLGKLVVGEILGFFNQVDDFHVIAVANEDDGPLVSLKVEDPFCETALLCTIEDRDLFYGVNREKMAAKLERIAAWLRSAESEGQI